MGRLHIWEPRLVEVNASQGTVRSRADASSAGSTSGAQQGYVFVQQAAAAAAAALLHRHRPACHCVLSAILSCSPWLLLRVPVAASSMPSTLPPGCTLDSPVWTASAVTSPLGPPLSSALAHRSVSPASTASLCNPAPCTIVWHAARVWDRTSLAAISEPLAREQTGLGPLPTPYTSMRNTFGA